MPTLDTAMQLPMSFANIPAEQPVQAAASQVQPFKAIDPIGQASRAFTLAEEMNTVEKQQRARADEQLVNEVLQQGGDLQTPEGALAIANQLKGKVAPATYQNLVKLHSELKTGATKMETDLAKMEDAKLDHIIKQGEFGIENLSSLLGQYEKTVQEKGVPGALEEFEKQKQVTVQTMLQMKAVTPEQAKEMSGMTPGQLEAKMRVSKFYMDRAKTAAEIKLRENQARLAGTRADTEEAGGKEAILLKSIEEEYGKDSPEYKAAVSRLSGKGGAAGPGAVGSVDMSTQSGKDAVDTAAWDLLLHGKSPSARGGMQQQVYARVKEIADEAGMSTQELMSAGSDFKSRIQAKLNIERRIQNTERAENQVLSEIPVVEALIPKLDAPSIPIAARGKIWVLRELGNPDVTRMDQAAKTIIKEFNAIMNGNPGALRVEEIRQAEEDYRNVQTPQQLTTWISQAKDMIARAHSAGQKTRAQIMDEANAVFKQPPKGVSTPPTPDTPKTTISPNWSGPMPDEATLAKMDPAERAGIEAAMARSGKTAGKTGTKESPAKVTSDADYEVLPSGAYFMGPDKVLRRKP